MPLESVTHVVGDSNVVSRSVDVASNDIDDSFFDSVHATMHARAVPPGIAPESAENPKHYGDSAEDRRASVVEK